jgi:hypothetical protein
MKLICVLILILLTLASCTTAQEVAENGAPPVLIQSEDSFLAEPPSQFEPEPEPEPEPELQPEPSDPENWPAHFAALVEEIRVSRRLSVIVGFHLMDITFDGIPELLVELRFSMGAGPDLVALTWDSTLEEAIGPSNEHIVLSGIPLRFFRNNDTGEIIYSSLYQGQGLWRIAYNFSEKLVPFRRIICGGANNHSLRELTDAGWETIEEYIVSPEALANLMMCDCDIQYGRNSQDPTIVHLVNLALEGFTEIPAPPIYTFEGLGDIDWGQLYSSPPWHQYMEEIQNWIFDVAESWDA